MEQKEIPNNIQLNEKLTMSESLINYHYQIKAMLDMLLGADLRNYGGTTLHEYFCVISDLVEQAQNLSKRIASNKITMV